MSELKKALEAANITIKKYDPDKTRPVQTSKGTFAVGKFIQELQKALGDKLLDHKEIVKSLNNEVHMENLLEEYASQELEEVGGRAVNIPDNLKHLELFVDRKNELPGAKAFFCVTPEGVMDTETSGSFYINSSGISPNEATRIAKGVVPAYMPRSKPGIQKKKNHETNLTYDHFNTYVPPEWDMWRRRNPKAWDRLPATPPKDIIRMLQHVIPSKAERDYMYGWLYTSLTARSFVYLVLCGAPGVGKNRIKLLFRALHGKKNSVDGKKETFGANESKFNSQMLNSTLIWFDELKYGPDMEPRMKEYQNTNIAIEKKGVDATQSSEIFSSMVISNNYPRDNYLLFNSRKFAPLVLGSKALTFAMTELEIQQMSAKLDASILDTFDVKYVAQIAKWILKIGGKYAQKHPNMEYQGPKFWELAHTSMSRWQKIAVLALTSQTARGMFQGWDNEKKSFLWSKVEESLRRKKEYESKDYRDATTVKAFFDTYCDEKGKKVFTVEEVPDSVFQDFWVKPAFINKTLGKIEIDGIEKILETVSPEEVNSKTDAYIFKAAKKSAAPKPKLVRPPGLTSFQWRKMKEEAELEEKQHGEDEEDDL